MRAGVNKVIVQVESTIQDHVILNNGFKLYLEIEEKVEHIAQTKGKVIAIPDRLNGKTPDLLPDEVSYSDMALEVEVGDIAHFRYRITNHEGYCIDPFEKQYYVPYEDIFCIERDGRIIPIGGWVLMEKLEESTFKSKLIVDPFKIEKKGFGKIRYIGTPIAGQQLSPLPKVGDEVLYESFSGEKYKINGEEFLMVYQHEIIMIM